MKPCRLAAPVGFSKPLRERKVKSVTDADGGHVGRIEGQFSFRGRYEVPVDDASSVPKEAVVAAAMVIDAIQGS